MELTIKLRRDNAATWTSVNPVLAEGEVGVELDTRKAKVGDGVTPWNSLAYSNVVPHAGIIPATHTKVTYDAQGIITSGEDIVLTDVTDITATASEVNQLHSSGVETADLTKLHNITADANELNVLDGITASTAELNVLDGITATTAELNILDGVTADKDEINILDGATLTTTELNYVDGVTSSIQTQLNSKVDFTTNENVSVATLTKTVDRYESNQVFFPNGIIIGKGAQDNTLATRSICGIQIPSADTGACTKENLYVNYDGDSTYRSGRQLVLQAASAGDHYGNNVYQYAAVRGDALKAFTEDITGLKTNLTTTEKTNLVGAINEVDSHADTNATNIGTLANLTTDAKTNLVAAINEVDGHADTNATNISNIEAKIPVQATSSNQLADKEFVNSSIATNTGNFIGTFNSIAERDAYQGTLTNNDYCFVIETDQVGNTVYNRYKWSTATTPAAWQFEYALNNSSFTADQWAAINSNITAAGTTQITTNKNAIGTLSNLTTTEKTNLVGAINELDSSKQENITGAATTIVSSDLTTNRALISNGSGKVAVSSVTDTELGYVSGVTSAIQTQLDNKSIGLTIKTWSA